MGAGECARFVEVRRRSILLSQPGELDLDFTPDGSSGDGDGDGES